MFEICPCSGHGRHELDAFSISFFWYIFANFASRKMVDHSIPTNSGALYHLKLFLNAFFYEKHCWGSNLTQKWPKITEKSRKLSKNWSISSCSIMRDIAIFTSKKIIHLEHKKGFLMIYNLIIIKMALYFFSGRLNFTAKTLENYFFVYFLEFCS